MQRGNKHKTKEEKGKLRKMNWALYLFFCASLVFPLASQSSVPSTTQQVPAEVTTTTTTTTMRKFIMLPTQEPVCTEHYDFPIEMVRGLLYFDVSGAQNLTLVKNDQNVQGITAKIPSCNLQELEILTGYRVHENLRKNCKNLHKVTLKGTNWNCRGPLWQFAEALRGKITYKNAYCGDIRCGLWNCTLEKGMSIARDNGLQEIRCPDMCRCYSLLYKAKLQHSVVCEKVNLTDDRLPLSIPPDTTKLVLSNNKLQSVQPLFDELGDLTELEVLYLDENKINAFPFFKNGSFEKLERVFLSYNQITKINSKAVESVVNARENKTQIHLDKNPIHCTEDIYEINVLQITRHYVIPEWNRFQCYDETLEKNFSVKSFTMELRENIPKAELDPLVVFLCFAGAMNIFFVYIIYDLSMAIKEMKMDVAGRRPILDKIICGISHGCTSLWNFRCQQSEYESCDSSDVFYKGPDQVSIRRRTPKPVEE